MFTHKHRHLIYYTVLFSILGLSSFLYLYFTGYPGNQFIILVFCALSYFLWGVMTHLLEGDLHIKIVVEYFLIALLALILAKGLRMA